MPPLGPQQTIQALRRQVADLTAQVQAATAQRDANAAQVAALTVRVNVLDGQCRDLTARLDQAQGRLATVQPQLDQAQQKLNESLEAFTKLGRAAGNLSNQLDQCKVNFEVYRQSIADQTLSQQAEVKRWEDTAWKLQGAVRMLVGEKMNKDPLSVTEAELDEWQSKWVAFRQPGAGTST